MKDKNTILNEIFENDPLEILKVSPKKSAARTSDDRLASSFDEINEFIEKNEREPNPDPTNISEYKLYATLKGLRENQQKIEALKPQDKFDLLSYEIKEINSLDDILGDDSLGILGDDSEGLFDFKHTPKDFERAKADFIGKRVKCKDFDNYEHLFKDVQNDLALGKRKLIEFKLSTLREGNYYVHNGILFYLEKIEERNDEKIKDSHKDGRTRLIFENGTESNIQLRTVEKNLYKNGKSVTENLDKVLERFNKRFGNINDDDKESGYIYVLKSKSKNPEINSIENLYKIGYASKSIDERIKNAKNEPTYLMAEVQKVASWKCYNLNPLKFEQLIQKFFDSCRLQIDVFDNDDVRHSPREWFVVPMEEIENAVSLIISEKIVDFKYDSKNQKIVRK